ncbi:MAG: TonB-dependent receptor [Verrucomicrobiae bacterium]|nr:TonB-dependent receptor [Verrucomicrobiae bacterium]
MTALPRTEVPRFPPIPQPCLRGLCWLLLVLLAGSGAAQTDPGSLAGLVVNGWDGRPIPGVIVTVRGTLLAATTDLQGRYRLEGVPPGDQTVRFSKSGFASASTSGVRVAPGLATSLDGTLRPEFYELEEYEVTAETFQDQTIEILEQRQSSASFLDAIGSEQFRRLGVTDAAQVIAKLPGTTVVDGKFAVIRGLSDRYNLTQLNGALIPTADPYRVGAPLDIIPAAMIQEISVNKTFTPDLPGGFAGGLANLKTKSFPDRFILSFEVGLEYNTQSTFNSNFLSYPGSEFDWAGFGLKNRAMPSQLEGQTGQTLQAPRNAPANETPEQAAARAAQADKVQSSLGSFPDYSFGGTPGSAPPPNYGGTFSVGETLDLNGHDFGYFVSGVYRRRWFFYDDGVQNRYRYTSQGVVPLREFTDVSSLMEVQWASVVSLAYELVPEDHTLAFTFYWNQSGEDLARLQRGEVENVEQVVDANLLQWTQRQIHAFQIQGTDRFERLHEMETDWLISIANTSQDEPDLRMFNYAHQPNGTGAFFSNSLPEPIVPTRFYRTINEDAIWSSLNNKLPFKQWADLDGHVKFGGGFNGAQRQFTEQTFQFDGTSGWSGPTIVGTPNNYFNATNILYTTTTNRNGINYSFQRRFVPAVGTSFYNGQLQIPAGYAMAELPLLERFKIVGGARMESTLLGVDGGSAGRQTNSLISQLDVMPAVSTVFQIVTNMNLRASFSQTVARPTFREIAPYRSYDPYGNEIIEGNPNLQMTDITNYDLRWEYFPRPGTVFSVSGFYKYLEQPIEKVAVTFGGGIVTFENRKDATLYGIELEANTRLDILDESLDEFIVGFNFAWIKSEVEWTATELANKQVLFPDTSPTRPLYDQSPWIVNFDLTYDHKATGTTATVSLGASGPYIFLVDRAGPDVYQHPPVQLNFVATQRLTDHWKLRLSCRNLLNPDALRTYGEPASGPVYSRATLGSTIALVLNYEY